VRRVAVAEAKGRRRGGEKRAADLGDQPQKFRQTQKGKARVIGPVLRGRENAIVRRNLPPQIFRWTENVTGPVSSARLE